jgi:hypothetical protein
MILLRETFWRTRRFRTPSWRAGMDERLSHVIAFHGAMRIFGARQVNCGVASNGSPQTSGADAKPKRDHRQPLSVDWSNRAHENAWRSRSHDERRDSPERRAQIPRRERIAGRIVATIIGVGLAAALVAWGTQ